jgi:hypothetical protein
MDSSRSSRGSRSRSLRRFLVSVLVQKIGTALAFVVLFYLARDYFGEHWLQYVGLWFVMSALTEVGEAIGPDYSAKEAVAGVISEAIYLPSQAGSRHSCLRDSPPQE